MRNRLIILLLSFFFLTTTYSQEKQLSFTLEEAIQYALENNRAIKNAERDVEAAKKRKWETTTMGLPQVSAKVDYQNWLKQQVSLVPAEFFGGNAGEFAEIAFGTKQNINATATLNQLLFDGSYLVGLQSAKVFLEISKNAKEKTDLEIRKTVINAYGNVLLAEESVTITKNNKAVLEKNLNETQKIYENGLTEEENVEQLQITLLQLDTNLKNAIRLRDIAYKMLNITLGIDLNETIILKSNLETLAEQYITLNLLDANETVENTIDYKIALNDKRSKELLLKLEKSKA
ncbi:MAG TPA: TolC family protein, partial [Flavobacteriia bacterium]|nr:TolC family protein [Flavobacteriia bacterium]